MQRGLLATTAGILLSVVSRSIQARHAEDFFFGMSSSFWAGVVLSISIILMLAGIALIIAGASNARDHDGDV